MASPFPGMDPYLEGYLWPDVHSALANKIRQLLAPLLRPRYTARLAIYVVEDVLPESDIGIMYPDVEIMQQRSARSVREAALAYPAAPPSRLTPATLSIPMVLPVEIQIPVVEIRDTAQNRLITSIEVLSPVNKREPGLQQYRQKRQRLYHMGVHLIEIDLLRRGTRPMIDGRVHASAYAIGLTRAQSGSTLIWAMEMSDPLPTIPVPLHPPDEDAWLDLGDALQAVYEEAGYDLSINYAEDPPPPPLTESERQIMHTILHQQ
jgi:hypothetical protein